MVLLAKWILENYPNARVAIIKDRNELDKQIEGVFKNAGETIKRTSSGVDLMKQLGQASPRLVRSLVHIFGKKMLRISSSLSKILNPSPARPWARFLCLWTSATAARAANCTA
jgi:type I restriction enzyme R subunit